MKKIFASGSCRVLLSIKAGRGVIEPIHSLMHNFVGINFLGKFHNTKQHIQFIDWIHERVEIHEDWLKHIFTKMNETLLPGKARTPGSLLDIRKAIRSSFSDCDFYMFEICSTKIYEVNNIQMQCELWTGPPTYEQSESQIIDDLEHLVNILPENAKVLLQCHFRPNIYGENQNLAIPNRELIYTALKKFSDNNSNIFLWDPSQLLNQDKTCFGNDYTHFSQHGLEQNFNRLFDIIEAVNIT
jgi:hypothetical protein